VASLTLGLHKHPGSLATLRVGKLMLDLTAVGLGLWAGGFGLWSVIWVPVFASLEHQGVEFLVLQYVESRRQQVRLTKRHMVSNSISAPLSGWLIQWPTSGGSAYERLQIVLRRVPLLLRQLTEHVAQMAPADTRPAPPPTAPAPSPA